MFILLILASFSVGILACIPIAKYVSPPPAYLLITLFFPWILLLFFAQNPMISDIRYMYLSFLIGMCCYWTYFETVKKIRRR